MTLIFHSIFKKLLIYISVLISALALWLFDVPSLISLEGWRGRVLDSTTQQPIPNASVTLECRRYQLHGSKKIREVTALTDKDGVYRFGLSDVLGCHIKHFYPAKVGYKDSSQIHTGYSYKPYEYLTKDADVTMLKLIAITPSGATFGGGSVSAYEQWYRNFIYAKAMAETDREILFVLENYCEELAFYYSNLNSEEKDHIASMNYSIRWKGNPTPGDHNYVREVVKYCSKT